MPNARQDHGLLLTAAQTDIWLAQQIAPDSPIYNIAWYLDIGDDMSGNTGKPLDHRRLVAAVGGVVARAGCLHVRFVTGADGRPRQVPVPVGGCEPVVLDLRTKSDPIEAANAWIQRDLAVAVDLEHGPLFTQAVLRLTDDHYRWYQRYHHAVMDGYGVSVMNRAVAQVYTSDLLPGEDGSWELSRLIGADTAYRASERFAIDADHWASQVANSPEPVRVLGTSGAPVDRALHHSVELPIAGMDRLHAAAAMAGVRVSRVVIAALAAYVARVAGARELVVALPVAARQAPELRDVPGMVSTVLPLHLRVDPGAGLADLARHVDDRVRVLAAHGHYRGEDLARVHGGRDIFGPSLNVMVTEAPLWFGEHLATMRNVLLGPVGDLELAAYVGPRGEPLVIDLRADPATADGGRLTGLGERLRLFLDRLAAEPARPVGTVDLLGADERWRILVDWNDTAEPVAARTVPDLFGEQVRRTPGATALVAGARRLTYRELDQRSAELAGYLRTRGPAPEQIVAIGLPRSAEMIVGLLAVLRAGGAFVPLDPGWPVERRDRVLTDSAAAYVMTGPGGVTDVGPEAVHLDLDNWRFAGCDVDVAGSGMPVLGGQLAYVMFTSGSTGVPKGVMIRHDAICERLSWQIGLLGFGAGDASLFKAPLSFDISVNEVLLPLVSGGRLVVAEPGGERDPVYLLGVIRDEGVTFVYLVSSMLEALLSLDRESGALTGLRHVWCGGEVLTPELFERFRAQLRTTMYHGYGPAETTIGVSHVVYHEGAERIATSIGQPNPNTRLYVLDPDLNPVPVSVAGELYVGGNMLGRGYVGSPGLTASRFVADPFGPPGGLLYRTGDLVGRRPDGSLDFVGRADNQVKIRGMRLELEEVEAALAANPTVRDVVVTVCEAGSDTAFLAAYVIPTTGGTDADRLREWAALKLPEYMVPAAFVVLDKLPLTANGKIDRRALPAPQLRSVVAHRPPGDRREALLCAVFREVLGLDRVGVDDDFFTLGGDSISAIQLVSRARRDGLALRPRDVFELRTVAALAAAADARATETPSAEPGRNIGTDTGAVEPTPILAWLRDSGGPADGYHQSALLRVPAELDADRLAAVLQAVLDRHDLLRARLDRTAGWTLEVPEPGAVRADDLLRRAEYPAPEEVGAGAEYAAAAGRLDPDAGVMLQAVWFDAGRSRPGRLLLLVHHLVVDGVSWRILFDDLAEAWRAVRDGRPVVLPPVSTSFRSWSRQLRTAVRDGVFAAELPAWRATVDAPDPVLGTRPLDPARDVAATARSTTVTLPAELTAPLLGAVPAAHGGTVNDVLLAAFALAVAHHREATGRGGGSSVLLDLEGHGREDAAFDGTDLTRTVGWFTAVHPVRLDPGPAGWDEVCAGGPAASRAVKAVKDRLRAIPGHGLGYGVLRRLDPEHGPDLECAPQLLVNYLGRIGVGGDADWTPSAGSGGLGGGRDPRTPLSHVLEVNATVLDRVDGPVLTATLTWPDRVLDGAEADALGRDLIDALAGLARRTEPAGHSPSDFPLVPLDQDDVDALDACTPRLAEVLPLSPLQEGLYFHAIYDRESPGGDVYVVQQVIELVGSLDPESLRAAALRLLDRHAALRASFHQLADDRLVQVLETRPELQWQVVDHRGLDADTARERLDAVADTERARGFDLARSPLQRSVLVREAADRHRLVLTSHHILADGWSVPIMTRELLALYAPHGEPARLPAVTPYRDHLDWLARRDRDGARAAWRAALSGVDEPTLLARRPGAEEEGDGAAQRTVRVALDAATTAALTGASRANGLTLSTLVHCAWGLALGAATGRPDLVFGSTVSGRGGDLPGVESMVGLFINTVPVRFAPDPADTLAGACARWQREQAALFDHQHLGLAEIHRITGLPELFDTLVVFENYPGGEPPTDPGGALSVAGVEFTEGVHYPLAVIVDPGPELAFELRHDPARVDGVGELGARLLRVLTALATDPETPVATLDLRSAAERRRALEAGVGPVHSVGTGTLPGRIAAQAARTPEATAVVADDATLSYAELDRLAASLAARLRAAGAGPGAVVGVAVPRSAELIVALLGVLRSGAAYLPLDLDYPAERLELMLADSGMELMVTATTATPARRVPLRPGVTALPAGLAADVPGADVSGTGAHPDEAAYMIYTSGSTGRPKGVVVSHRAITNRLAWMQHEYRLTAEDRVLQKTPASFDVSVWEFFWALCEGAAVVLARPEGHRDPVYLAELVRAQRVTTMHFVPSMLEAFLAAEEVTADPSWAGSLRRVFASGEALPLDVAARWRALTAVPLHNLYGPTEAAVDVTHHACGPGDTVSVPIGRPVWNTQVHVLDPLLRPVADGVPGELYLVGVQLARGYHARPGLTADRFVANPFGMPGERMYRTGDVVRRRADGSLEYLGRTDHQVKIRGNRIELGEIEAELSGLVEVARAAVTARRDGAAQSLVAYVVPAEGAAPEPGALREALAGSLPAAMVPSAVVVLDDLPLTPSGKLDRAALPAPEPARPEAPTREPTTETERVLCAAFAEVLGRDRCAPDDDFFALGGDSISSISVSSRARRAGLPVGPQEVFAGRTPAGTAALVDPTAPDPGSTAGVLATPGPEQLDRVRGASPVPVAEVWPLSPLQDGLFFHATLDGVEADVYTIQEAIDLDHRLDLDRLRAACATVLTHNDAIRAGFTSEGLDGPVQFVAEALEPPVTEIDLCTLPDAERAERLAEVMATDRATHFDLDRPPLFRLLLVRLGDRDRLVVNRHLLLWDGWSAWLFVEQLFAAYAGDDPGPAGSYRDYLAWLAGQDFTSAAEAWRTALSGLDEPTLVAPAVQCAPGATGTPRTRDVELLPDTTARLRALAREHGLTGNTVLSTVWGLVLGAATGRTDVVFGTSVAGRPTAVPDVESTIGLFLNTVPARMAFRPGEPVLDLLRRVQDERLALLSHESMGLGEIQRVAGHRRLFDTLFVYRPEGGEERVAELGARHGISAMANADATHYPLNLIVTPGERIRLTLLHTLDDAAAAVYLERFTRLLDQVLDDPATPAAWLEPLLAGEREAIAAIRDGAALPVGTDTIAELLAERAAAVPDALALVSGDVQLSYAELDAAVDRTARLLLARGAGPERTVALGIPRSVETVVALFAVLRIGAAYLPLELDHPAERLGALLRDAAPVCLLTVRSVAESLAGAGVPAVVLDDPGTAVEYTALPAGPLSDDELGAFARTNPDRLELPAYVIYTSGSTGQPKGVVTPYRGLTNMQRNHRSEIFDPVVAEMGQCRLRIAHTVSFAFDMSWEELLWLVEGHEVHVCDEELRRDAEALVAYCDAHAVDVVNVTPTYATALFEAGLLEEGHGRHRPTLVLLGGEAVSDAVWTTLRETPGTTGYNLYGPTEYTINTLGAETADSVSPTVGRPIANTRAYVLDPWLRPVPDGVPGELYIAGAGLARGYLDRFGLTAERFVADPENPGGRMYRTGDLVCRRPGGDGILDFLGRTDDQVKIRGYRVEPGEVAAALTDHPAVTQAVVVADRSGPGGLARLVGYVVPEPGGPGAAGSDVGPLREYLRERLPDYLVPAAIVAVESVPLTVNGKLDTGALPRPELTPTGAGRTPLGRHEEVLCALFAQVLDLPRAGPEDDFFDLGGHSLLATRLLSRARSALSADLVLRDLFEAPTPAELAVRAASRTAAERPELRPTQRSDAVALSAAQQRLWLVQQIGGAAYNFPIVLRLGGELDADALDAALQDVAGRHETLRTIFADGPGGTPVQRVLDDVLVPLARVSAESTEAERIVAAELNRPFDLSTELPLRATLIAVGPDEHVLVLLLHHITTDEWSDRPFLDDLASAYTARQAGQEPAFTPLQVQYADYALWHTALLGDRDDPASPAARQLDFWQRTLDGAPDELVLPTDRSRPARPTFTGGTVNAPLDPDTVDGLRGIARDTGASMLMVLQAAVAALLNRLGAGEDIPLGTPVAGRTDERLDNLVGFFVNTVVLRTDVSGAPGFAELTARVRDADLAAFSHADVPFEAVVERLNPPRSLARNPLFQVMVGYHARGGELLDLPGVAVTEEPVTATTAKFDLVFSFVEHLGSGAVTLHLEYAADLFDHGTAQRLGARFARLAAAAASESDSRLDELEVFVGDERALVLEEFAGRQDVREVATETLVDAFERWVRTTPGATAVVDPHRNVTYAELDALAEGAADLLGAHGAGVEDLVGVMMPRTVDMVAMVLGIMKLGAAWLPLDLRHPGERFGYLLTDSGARTLVATPEQAEMVPAVDGLTRVLVPEGGLRPADPRPRSRPEGLDHAAYVIYTSGSTGRPKGVVVPHDGITSLAATAADRMGVTAASRVLQFASVGFDVAAFELTMSLCLGARLVIIPDEARVAGSVLTDFLAEHGTTHGVLPPSLVAALPPDCLLPDGMTVLLGTETVPPDLIERWAERLNLMAAYGLTEATVNSTLWRAEPDWRAAVPIGEPDPNTTAYVLDERLCPVPPGVVGDLYIGGRGLARGYLGRPALTAERFIADPFGPPGARLYRTGDRARWRRDGNLDFLGRGDDQVKIRGFRIELGEVAAALSTHDDVSQAVAVAESDGDLTRLIGYVVPAAGTTPTALDPSTLRAHVGQRLPEYMVPAITVLLDGPVPLTPNGKLDRRALPPPDWSQVIGDGRPETPEQQRLAELFAEVLHLPKVGIHDDFFALGGHSMASMRLIGQVRSRLGADLSIRDMFDAPTVAALARLIGERPSGRPELVPTGPPAGAEPLAPVQHWRWERHRIAPRPDHALVLRPDEAYDGDALAAAVDDVTARHEPLRTVFSDGPHGPRRHVRPSGPRLGHTSRALEDLAAAPFDLTAEPPFRTHLVTGDDGRQALLLVLHYLGVDEWSVVPLLRDLGAAYAARREGREPGWAPLPVGYTDFARWASTLQGDPADPASRHARALHHWRGVVGEMGSWQDWDDDTDTDDTAKTVAFVLDQELRRGVGALARRTRTSMFMVLQAALATVLARRGAGPEVPIASFAAGRTEAVLADLVGCVANVLVLPVHTGGVSGGGPDLEELLGRIREDNLAALDHQEVGFAEVADAAGLHRPPVLLVHHEEAGMETEQGVLGRLDAVPVGGATADLTVSFYESPGDLPVHVALTHRLAAYDDATAIELVDALLRVLRAAM